VRFVATQLSGWLLKSRGNVEMYGPKFGSPDCPSDPGLCKNMCIVTSCTGLKTASVLEGYSGASVFTLIIALAGIVNKVVEG
jgi:hypothetical protein